MPRRSRGRWSIAGLGIWALAFAFAAPVLAADVPKPLYHKSRSFRIPFNVDPTDRPRLREVELWISEDKGFNWKEWSHTGPDAQFFTFRAPKDGEYWFAVRTVNLKGQEFPPKDRPVEPSMRVIVDTQPPRIELATLGRRGSRASVCWEISDEYLNLKSLVIEYQARGARDWRQVPNVRSALLGSVDWDAGTADPVSVRAAVEDLAHNRAEKELDLPDGIAVNPGPATFEHRDYGNPPPVAPIASAAMVDAASDPFNGGNGAPQAAPTQPAPRSGVQSAPGGALLVGSARFPLAYGVEDAGPGGPSLVELWVTRDGGRSWSRLPEDPDRVSPYIVDLGGEGTFGLWLVVQGANGLGDPPPAPGDRPQMWVEVDSTPPAVQMDPPRVGAGTQAGKVTINWRASDAHLAQRPIVVYYRPDRPDGTWQPISARIDNTGSFTWNVPPNVPGRFYLRVDAFDTLGNRGSAETANPIVVDRTRPRGRIIGLDPSARSAMDERSVR
jgi:hypothetical protein